LAAAWAAWTWESVPAVRELMRVCVTGVVNLPGEGGAERVALEPATEAPKRRLTGEANNGEAREGEPKRRRAKPAAEKAEKAKEPRKEPAPAGVAAPAAELRRSGRERKRRFVVADLLDDDQEKEEEEEEEDEQDYEDDGEGQEMPMRRGRARKSSKAGLAEATGVGKTAPKGVIDARAPPVAPEAPAPSHWAQAGVEPPPWASAAALDWGTGLELAAALRGAGARTGAAASLESARAPPPCFLSAVLTGHLRGSLDDGAAPPQLSPAGTGSGLGESGLGGAEGAAGLGAAHLAFAEAAEGLARSVAAQRWAVERHAPWLGPFLASCHPALRRLPASCVAHLALATHADLGRAAARGAPALGPALGPAPSVVASGPVAEFEGGPSGALPLAGPSRAATLLPCLLEELRRRLGTSPAEGPLVEASSAGTVVPLLLSELSRSLDPIDRAATRAVIAKLAAPGAQQGRRPGRVEGLEARGEASGGDPWLWALRSAASLETG